MVKKINQKDKLSKSNSTNSKESKKKFDPLFYNKIVAGTLVVVLFVLVVNKLVEVYYPELSFSENTVLVETPDEDAVEVLKQDDGFGEDELVSGLLASASIEKGEQGARICKACHTINKGGKKKIGPNLWDVIGRKPGSSAGFDYSKALTNYGNNAKKWDYESINKLIYNPSAFIEGERIKMSFGGIKNVKKRADIIKYLWSLTDKPAPLPK